MYWHRLHGCYGQVSVCPKSIIQLQQWHVTDLLLSATWTGNIDRQQRALSNNCGQCRVDSRIDEAEDRTPVR